MRLPPVMLCVLSSLAACSTAPIEECKDLDSGCADYARLGDSCVDWMAKNCRKTCGCPADDTVTETAYVQEIVPVEAPPVHSQPTASASAAAANPVPSSASVKPTGGSNVALKRGKWNPNDKDRQKTYGADFQHAFFDGKWRMEVMEYIYMKHRHRKGVLLDWDMYEYGVYTGGVMRDISWFLTKYKLFIGTFWGFDSFQGLPAEEEDKEFKKAAKLSKIWSEGAFSSADMFNADTFADVVASLRQVIGPTMSPVHFVKGYYQDSLTPTLAQERQMRPALYIDIDVDIYSSSIQCLDWLFASGIVQVGTIIGYDDWPWGLSPMGGEMLAHHEVTKKYQVVWKEMETVRTKHMGSRGFPFFEVISIGGKNTSLLMPEGNSAAKVRVRSKGKWGVIEY